MKRLHGKVSDDDDDEENGRSRVRIPAEAETRAFAGIGNLLTTSVSPQGCQKTAVPNA